ncbi:MAG: cupin domain-containing protein [Planctomycetota bacterium]|nr:cupin domain-containing protein [Planctomycetota bacterium]
MSESNVDLNEFVEGRDGISVIRASKVCRAWNGIRYKVGMCAENVGSAKLSMNVAQVAPGGIAYAHIHDGFELMLYILQGKVRHIYGDGLGQEVVNEAGDFIYIEPGVPHEVYNMSDTEPVVAVVARSDASEWQNIVSYPSPARDRAESAEI